MNTVSFICSGVLDALPGAICMDLGHVRIAVLQLEGYYGRTR